MAINAPDRLAYLFPAFGELAEFAPEELGDDNPEAMDVVEGAVRQRIRGMTADEASQAVQSDLELLQVWISNNEAPDTAHYVYGALFGMTMFADFGELRP